MKLGIMQPYFLPYLGYISLIKNTDEFILFDTVQFIRHGWIERNRILKQTGGWQYIQIPLEKKQMSTVIKEVRINNKEKWKDKILAQLQHYKKIAPYYYKTIKILKTVFEKEYDSITELNKTLLEEICKYLEIETPIFIFSEMNLKIGEVNAPDEWALEICKAIGNVSEYWNPPGGLEFFNKTKYEKENIKIYFQKINLHNYDQRRESFEKGLSIIDVLMFNSPEEINKMLDDYELL